MKRQKARSKGGSKTGEGGRVFEEHGRDTDQGGKRGHEMINDDRTNPETQINSPAEAKEADRSDTGLGSDPGESTVEETLQDRIKH